MDELIDNINNMSNEFKKKLYKQALLEVLDKDFDKLPDILTKIKNVYEDVYIDRLISYNKFVSIIIVCVVILVITFMFIVFKWNSFKFDKVGMISSVIAFLCIASYQAWFTFNIGLNRKAYELPNFNKEVIPELVHSKEKPKKSKKSGKFLGVKRTVLKLDC